MRTRFPSSSSAPLFAESREAAAPYKAVLSVSELLRSARDLLERRFPLSWIGGEISNLSRAASGHFYFCLKDDSAQVECVMYRTRATALDWEPREGQRVEARALVTLYEPRGRFQLNVESLRLAGLGALYERFLRLKEQLERDGLFAAEAKRAIPSYPRRIGIVTSLAAAALHDVLTTLARRNPALPVVVYPVPVQGAGAAEQIARMLRVAGARAECDVLLLVRGGGSIEDLWSFNDESVARAIRACAIPVVVGVGHETDVTIADLAADRRAPTPTAAAELVSSARVELLERVAGLAARAAREARRQLDYAAQGLDAMVRRLAHPRERLQASRALLAQLTARLTQASARRVEALEYRLGELPARLGARLASQLAMHGAELSRLRASLTGLDPVAVLARGYSITRNSTGAVVSDPAQVADGERLHTTLAKGSLESEVKKRD
jgi:exodeoxyribonuclease VII large subunit